MTIGEKIALLRTAKGISQEDLANIIGVSRQTISKWEMNQAQPSIDKLIQVCSYFQISTDTFY